MMPAAGLARHRGLVLAVVLASLGVAYQHHRFARAGARYDRFDLPGFDAHVYVAMATRPPVFSVAPWGYRVLTPVLVEAWPVRTVRAFRDVTAVGLVAAGVLLFLWLRRLGNGEWASLLAVVAYSLSGPVAEAVQYRFLVEPVTAALAAGFLLALAAGAPVVVLALVATLGTLSKEFFLLLLPLVLIERRRLLGWSRALLDMLLVAVPAVGITLLLRVGWTPYLAPPLPRPGAALLATALERFAESLPEWRGALLLGGLLPLALVGGWLPKGRPRSAQRGGVSPMDGANNPGLPAITETPPRAGFLFVRERGYFLPDGLDPPLPSAFSSAFSASSCSAPPDSCPGGVAALPGAAGDSSSTGTSMRIELMSTACFLAIPPVTRRGKMMISATMRTWIRTKGTAPQ